jgi:uncharacterized protein (TIGR03000 family)
MSKDFSLTIGAVAVAAASLLYGPEIALAQGHGSPSGSGRSGAGNYRGAQSRSAHYSGAQYSGAQYSGAQSRGAHYNGAHSGGASSANFGGYRGGYSRGYGSHGGGFHHGYYNGIGRGSGWQGGGAYLGGGPGYYADYSYPSYDAYTFHGTGDYNLPYYWETPAFSSFGIGSDEPAFPAEDDSSRPNHGLASIDVYLPQPEAQLTANGKATRQRGNHRQFETNPIAKGKKYTVHFVASWMANGRRVSQTRTVTLRPGQHESINFAAANGEDTAPQYLDKVQE